jgi:hypothetical protein
MWSVELAEVAAVAPPEELWIIIQTVEGELLGGTSS